MLQIVHDIAPKAKLSFRTGFITAGDMAEGIHALAEQDSCDIIVDDVTYITEPYFQDGIVSRAVNEVRDMGVAYFTSAGNFGGVSYESYYNPMQGPASIPGMVHDFGGGDYLQAISLKRGTYTLVMQWDDSLYSLGQLPGARNNFDIYLTDLTGTKLFGLNRQNNWGDPIEVLPFTVTADVLANIVITRTWTDDPMGPPMKIKYIIFRGDATILEHQAGSSTIIGQANCDGAMSVGAVRYTKTPRSARCRNQRALPLAVVRQFAASCVTNQTSAHQTVSTRRSISSRAIWRVTASTTSMVLPARLLMPPVQPR